MHGTTELIASLDLGTTSARAIIFNAEGRPLAASQKPLTQYFPHDGWVEQDAEEIWQKQKECLLGTLADLKLSGSGLRALGITNQRETTIVQEDRKADLSRDCLAGQAYCGFLRKASRQRI